MRTFCADKAWPAGDRIFPPLVTEGVLEVR
jgi:hypothetical protein